MTADVLVTGIGLAVPGLAGAGELIDPPGLSGPEPGFDLDAEPSPRGWKYRDRASQLTLRAVEPALRDAGLLVWEAYTGPPERTAVVVSSNLGCLDNACNAVDIIDERTSAALSPMSLPHTAPNMVAGWVAIDYGLHGPNLTLCNGPTSGLDALDWARTLIAAGRADVVVVAGVEPDNEVVARLLGAEGITHWLDGAAVVVLESARHAAERGHCPRLAMAGFARAATLTEAVRHAAPGQVGLWLTTEGGDGDFQAPARVPAVDLTARLGRCSGALGVLQCVAAVAAIDRGETGSVLATCAGAGAAAALVMTATEDVR